MSQFNMVDLDRMISREAEARRRRGEMHLVRLPVGGAVPPRPRVESKYPWAVLAVLRNRGPAAVSELSVIVPEFAVQEPLSLDMTGRGIAHLLRAGLAERAGEVADDGGVVWIRYRLVPPNNAVPFVRHRRRPENTDA